VYVIVDLFSLIEPRMRKSGTLIVKACSIILSTLYSTRDRNGSFLFHRRLKREV